MIPMKIIVTKLVLLALAVASLVSCGDSVSSEATKARITIVAKDQAFHLEDQPELGISHNAETGAGD